MLSSELLTALGFELVADPGHPQAWLGDSGKPGHRLETWRQIDGDHEVQIDYDDDYISVCHYTIGSARDLLIYAPAMRLSETAPRDVLQALAQCPQCLVLRYQRHADN